jgi:asparagine synthetase B (glutamine-hydrolysing)
VLTTRIENVTQPAINGHGVLLYNGTEYDLDHSDTNYILSNLSNNIETNIEFVRELTGDFSICFVTDNYIMLARDCFGTKPLFYAIDNNTVVVSSTHDSIKLYNMSPISVDQNTCLIIDRNTGALLSSAQIIHWNLTQGTKNIEDVWERFERSVITRHSDSSLVNLSSGYDSGAIVACLNKHLISYTTTIHTGIENKQILSDRILMQTGPIRYLDPDNTRITTNWSEMVDTHHPTARLSTAAAIIAKRESIRTIILGTGGDELYSDYGFNGIKLHKFSQFGGLFPTDLTTIWPWHTGFYPIRYCLPMIEYINGLHGIDSRHPFLDRILFQTWLNTDVKTKNKTYKHWIGEYLKILNYPYCQEKIGVGFTKVSSI